MATAVHSKAMRAYFDHFRVSQTISTRGKEYGADAAEVPVIEGEYKTFLQGKAGSGASSLNGPADITATTGWDTLDFEALTNGIHYVADMPNGNAVGQIAYENRELATADAHAYDQGGVFMLNWSGQGTGKFMRGQVLTQGEQVITTTGLLTGRNIGAATTAIDRIIVVRCVAVSGTGTFTLQFFESSDDAAADAYAKITGWTSEKPNGAGGTNVNIGTADQVTFTGTGVAFLMASKAIEAWTNINVTAFSGFTDATIVATVGNAATPD